MFGTGHRKYVAHGTVTESVGVCVCVGVCVLDIFIP